MRWRRQFMLVVAAAASLGQAAVDANPGRRVELKPCSADGVEAQCGTLEVFEDRESAVGGRITLKLVVLRADGPDKQPDPLFVLAGGPGQAASDNAKFFARVFAPIRRHRDIVLLDQRGTGGSNALKCEMYSDTQSHLADLLPLEPIRRCLEEWQKHADLRFYTTDVAMADLDEVRAALGYDQINLFGTSYGTRAAQVYMRQFDSRVRSVILKGVTPMGAPLTLAMPRDAQRAVDILFDDCAADTACHGAFPELKQDFTRMLERIEGGETEVELTRDGKTERVKIGPAAVAPTIRTQLQSIEGAAQLPLMIHRAANGDFAPIANAALSIRRGFTKGVSVGMFLAVTGSEDVAVTDEGQMARAGEGSFLRDHYFRQLQRAAKLLPRAQLPPNHLQPVRSDLPTLLISGFLDPATPPSGADEVARHLSKSRHLVARYGSHAYGGMSPCVDNIMAEFIARGSAEGIDASCVDAIRRPPFVPSEEKDKTRRD